MTAAAPPWRRWLLSLAVALLCVYLPHVVPLFLDHLSRDGDCRDTWLSYFPLLPGLALGPAIGAQITQSKGMRYPLIAAVTMLWTLALTWLGARGGRTALFSRIAGMS